MSHITTARTARRLFVVTGTVLAASVAFAVPASAHVEVEAEDAAALAENVTLDFTAESESDKAGITKLEVILPEGIVPADITYKEGPTGWKLAPTARGYAVSGPAVATGKDAAYSVTVRQLPEAKSLTFKTLQTYSDGQLDRWIELEKSSDGGHGSPAPILELKPAAPGAKPVSPSPTADATTAAPSTATPTASAAQDDKAGEEAAEETSDDGSSPALPITIGVVALAALAGGAWWWKRRSTAGRA